MNLEVDGESVRAGHLMVCKMADRVNRLILFLSSGPLRAPGMRAT